MLGLNFSSKLDWRSYIILIAKTASRKFEPWFILWSVFLLRLLCISINQQYNHPWDPVAMSGLVLLVATWNCWISVDRTVGSSLAASLEPFIHCQNVANLSSFYRHCFGICSFELAQLVSLPYSQGGLLVI